MKVHPFLLFALIGLSGCGDHLGNYKFERASLIETVPQEAVIGLSRPRYHEYLRIELSSDFSLYAAETGPGLYSDADWCPMDNPNQMIVFGPLASDSAPVENWNRKAPLSADPRDKRFHHFVYIVPSSAERRLFSNSSEILAAYDLRNRKEDVCLRFHVPGYNLIPSRSAVVKIPANAIADALRVPVS